MEFPTTQWTNLALATLSGDTNAQAAMTAFYQRYRNPVAIMLRGHQILENNVEDMTQEFFLELMKASTLRRIDPERGRFRQFLSGALHHFVSNQRRRQLASKRGGQAAILSLEAMQENGVEIAEDEAESFYNHFDRTWVTEMVSASLAKVQEEFTRSGKVERFHVLKEFLIGGSPIPSQEAAARLGMSDTAVRSEISRIREKFRDTLRSHVALTVAKAEDIDDELRYFHLVLAK